MKTKEKDFERLLTLLDDTIKHLSFEELKKEKKGQTLICLRNYLFTISTLKHAKHEFPSRAACVTQKDLYVYSRNYRGFYTQKTEHIYYSSLHSFLKFTRADKKLHDAIKKITDPDTPDMQLRSEEEKDLFMDMVTEHLTTSYPHIKKELDVEKMVDRFKELDQTGPLEIKALSPENCLSAHKRIEKELENILENKFHSEEELKKSIEYINAAKKYGVGTSHAKEILKRNIDLFKKISVSEIKEKEKQIKNAKKLKEDL